jgi:hypothetical protein
MVLIMKHTHFHAGENITGNIITLYFSDCLENSTAGANTGCTKIASPYATC